ncbi:MAG: DUF3307 domain-containing protein [Armatimonadota bacterium]|nr:DUF3307 domain-containing protein [Armatimonadota bacterium]MDR7421979.1 DUF3307 domain-containing protein [Armatimonadota bacterium]MDR7455557.1 DUF3307 domain-containing protein [Armatimonadota bacterium]MDR7456950.1 DUF3307 domain-containing protein [Armatimonadota bacterium]MDR7496473.1 DUF3307 domain-containing protein [Armatimonadota bacterium]
MSPWLCLLLAHLIADFILQPYELVRLKTRSAGQMIHAGIHAAVTAALIVPLSARGWTIAALVGVVHYGIDYIKVRAGYATGPASFAAFTLDQAVHLAALALVLLIAGVPWDAQWAFASAQLTAAMFYGIPYVAVTFAGAIVLYQLAVAYRTRSRPEDLLAPLPRLAGYLERGGVLTVLLFGGPGAWWLVAAWYLARVVLARGRRGRLAEIGGNLAMTLAFGLLFRS